MQGWVSDRKIFRTVFLLLCWDTAFATAYSTWLGPLYTSGLAGEIGLNLGVLTLLTSLPYIGAFGQIFGLIAFQKSSCTRKYTLSLYLAERVLWLVPISTGIYWGARSYLLKAAFPVVPWFCVVAVISCIAAIFSGSSTMAWMSWIQDLIPQKMMGRFFGYRQRYVVGALIVANGLAAFWVGWKPQGYAIGYAVMGVIALIAAAISTWIAYQIPAKLKSDTPATNPSKNILKPRVSEFHFAEMITTPLRDENFRTFVFFGAAFTGSMQLASPFFPYYFTRELHLTMSSIAFWTVIANVAAFFAAAHWGKFVDAAKDPRRILWYTGHAMALSPLLYALTPGELVQWIAPFDYLIYGLTFTGFTIASSSLLFKLSPMKNNSAYFSVYTAACGLSAALGTFIGGHLVQSLMSTQSTSDGNGNFRSLFLIATLCRLGVLWLFLRKSVSLRTLLSKLNTV